MNKFVNIINLTKISSFNINLLLSLKFINYQNNTISINWSYWRIKPNLSSKINSLFIY
uniref:Uncharacterized protein n=1 Tax=Glossina morsitans morsitans TaxID=37546 RepID=A0ABK9NGE5_GLOMM